MSNLFKKIGDSARLFTKTVSSPSFFRKVDNTARKTDHSMARVGSFLVDTANQFGLSPVASGIKNVVGNIHGIRNNLEKSIRSPIGAIKQNVYA